MIELVAATALAAVLMIAVLQVTASLGSTQAMLDRHQSRHAAWEQALTRQLASDVRQARDIKVRPHRLILGGAIGQTDQTVDADHQPATVTYKILRFAGHRFLVRDQKNLLDRTNHNTRVELLCGGVKRFTVRRKKATAKQPVSGAKKRPSLPSSWPLCEASCLCPETTDARSRCSSW